ncbi:3-oxo-5-alpha-steroid 4-dehydrogenase family protein [Aspergillus glaucus CBS 516.65]|uniref:3-oxo-5-alpha-steroid 4-dehydrogenase C-terminal domain-containing protein n=1 Tax=Aspergillus glaucus CBS 516.65 TaxID=1160497 RepID=A0A1L9VT12_ASPGL|nr:hypothetical protein ASPGLDRAFT_43507 [Aspergillus glaucus CBS 516.65]OJJ87032.1 hypothetical protein ASPGLDRAFT_43507 [Aspergillus glaucus CBS 516.65]
MGSMISSSMSSLPSLREFITLTPKTYAILVNIFQYFPVVTIAQWLLSYHPAGKTSLRTSPLNLPGRLAWCVMEIIAPLNLLYILHTSLSGDFSLLPWQNQLVGLLYVVHYVNRAVISPWFVAPSMSPIHVFVMVSAMGFNWVNSSCLAGWVLGYGLDVGGFSGAVEGNGGVNGGTGFGLIPCVGLGLFVVGMVGNVYSERALFRLRREEGDKRAAKKTDNNDTNDKYHKVYVIPPKQGVFHSILYPHYVFEWIEWFGFALAGTAIFPAGSSSVNPIAATATAAATVPRIRLAPWLVPAAVVSEKLRVPLPLPALVFAVNAVANMLPHARWGRKWYVEKFGEEAVGSRGVAVPWCPWL